MEIILLDKTNEELWNTFCKESDDAWFWHTTYWMDYVTNYGPDFQPQQLSFFVKEDNKFVAICPLILEDHNGGKEFSFSGFGIPVPALAKGLSPKIQKKVQNFIYDYTDQQAQSLGVKKAIFRFSPLAPGFLESELPPANYLTKYGYLDRSFDTQIADISPSIETLKNSVRKGHKYDINKSSRVLDINISYSDSASREMFDLYCEMHRKDAGIYTRSQITYDLMFEWIKLGYAVLLGAKAKETSQFTGFAYFITYKNGIYYASASKKNDLSEVSTAHFILWEAVKWSKERNIKYFEFGWQFYRPTFHYNTSKKECDISEFKRGFGGERIPQIVAEKYYDSELFEKEYRLKIENYKKYLNEKGTEPNENE